MEQNAFYILTILGIVLCTVEIFIPGFFIFPIGVGAIAGGIASYFGLQINGALLVWAITSLSFWLILRKLYKSITPIRYLSGMDGLIGKQGKVIEEINNDLGTGRVKVYGDEWEVLSENLNIVPIGKMVEIVGYEGNKVRIKL